MNWPNSGKPYIRYPSRDFAAVPRRLAAGLAFVLLIACTAACEDTSSDNSTSREQARQDSLAEYKEDDCLFTPPPRYEVQCGFLTVPIRRGARRSPSVFSRIRTADIHVAVFKAWGAEPKGDPVVFLEGGPGGVTLDSLPVVFSELALPFLEHRDVVFFDQRGTGHSTPSLACYELTYIEYDLASDATAEDERELYKDALEECRTGLRSDVSFESFSTKEIAADLEDLRKALGYEQWNLYGISYGTKVALTAMRDFPRGVRSAVLDSAYPLEVNLVADKAANISRAATAIFRACQKDKECDAEYPELEETFLRAISHLSEEPADLQRFDPSTTIDPSAPNEGLPARSFDGGAFVEAVNRALYISEAIPHVPGLISAVENEDYSSVTFLANLLPAEGDEFTTGLYLSVQCAEELAFTTRAKVEREFARLDEIGRVLTRLYIDDTFEDCAIWDAPAADAEADEPVKTDIPTLVLAGEFDPVTPPSYGKLVAENQRGSFFFEFPGFGHGVSVAGPCPQKVMLDFIDQPRDRPDARCRERIPSIDWIPDS